MTPRILNELEPFNYDNVLELFEAKQITNDDKFILHDDNLHLVREVIDGNAILESGDRARHELITSVRHVTNKEIDYVALVYCKSNKIVILYKDIEFVGSYYGMADKWMQKSFTFINDYFKNIIDGKMEASIDELNLDSSTILEIVNKYDLPNSRDLMLVHAIDKYANEMTTLLEAIDNPTMKKAFTGAVKKMTDFINPDEEETIIKSEVKTKVVPKKTTRKTRVTKAKNMFTIDRADHHNGNSKDVIVKITLTNKNTYVGETSYGTIDMTLAEALDDIDTFVTEEEAIANTN